MTDIRLDKRHFPYFLRTRDVRIEQVMLVVTPAEGQALNLDDRELRLNNLEGSNWLAFPIPESQPRAKTFALNEPLSSTGNQWTIRFDEGDLSAVDDLWILVRYRI